MEWSSRSRKRRRRIQRRERVDECPNAASSVNVDVSVSSRMDNPAIGIVCVDDSHPVDASNEYSQCDFVDPLCVNIKVDPDCPQGISANPSAVSHRKSSRLLCAENELQSDEAAPVLPLEITPFVVPSGTSFESLVEHDPLQLNDIKVPPERFEREIDAQTPGLRAFSQNDRTSVSAEFRPHVESNELSMTAQTENSQRLGTTRSDQESFACTKCTFKASTFIDLSKHLQVHQGEESNSNATQSQTSNIQGNLTCASSVSSPLCNPPALSRKASVPVVVTLDDEDSVPESRMLCSFQNASNLAIQLQASALDASSSNSNIPTKLSSPSATKTSEGHVEDILILSDLPGQGVFPSRMIRKSAVPVNPSPVPITSCSTSVTYTSNSALHWPSQNAVNAEDTRFHSLSHSQATTQHDRSVLDSRQLRNKTIDKGMGNNETPNTSQSPCQPAACSINYASESRHPFGSLGTTVEPSGIHQLTSNHLINKGLLSPSKSQCQANAFVTPIGSIKEIPTVDGQTLAEISEGLEPRPLLCRTFLVDQSKQCESNERISSNSVEGVSPSTCSSPLPPHQVLSTVPRKISVIQQPLRESSVNDRFPAQPSSQLLHPSHCASNIPEISRPLNPSINKSYRISIVKNTSAILDPICSTDTLRCPSAVQSTSSLLNHPVSEEPVQATDTLYGVSKESHMPHPSSLVTLANYVQSLPLNQNLSASTLRVQPYAQPKAPLPPLISANPPPLSILNRIDRLIEANAQVLERTPIALKPQSSNVPIKSASSPSKNTQSYPLSKQTTQSASLRQDVNFNLSSRILEGHFDRTNPTANLSQSTASMPCVLSRGNASSGRVPHAEIERGDCILLDESADLIGPQRPDINIAMNVAGLPNCVLSSQAKSTRLTYDLRNIPRKSKRTHTPSEKQNNSSADSDSSAVDDPDYLPPLGRDSDDDSDGRNSVLSAFPGNTIPTSSVFVTKPAANTGDKLDSSITNIASTVSIAYPTNQPSASNESAVACSRTASKEQQMHLDSSLSCQKSNQKSDRETLSVSNLRNLEGASIARPSDAPKSLFSRESTDLSVSQSLQVSRMGYSTNAMRLPVDASAESLPVSPILAANTFPEAHLSMLAGASGVTCATASTSEQTLHSRTSSILSHSTGIKAGSSNFEIPPTNGTNPVLKIQSNKSSQHLNFEGLLRGSADHVLEISTSATTNDFIRDVNSIPTNLQRMEPNSSCKEPQYNCRATNEIIFESTKSKDSSHTNKHREGTHSVGGTPLPIPSANASVESQPKRTYNIPESERSEKCSIRSNESAHVGNTSGVTSTSSPRPDQLGSLRGNPGKKEASNAVTGIDIASDDSSTDEDDTDPKRPRTKRSSGGSSSESGHSTMVDPDYVPPSRDKLPLKTPDSVLEEIPTFEHWVRSKFIKDDSDTDTPRPDNACCVCLRKFPSHESLKEHRVKRYKDLKCCKCPFKASTQKTLKTHTTRHTRPKPYACEECSQTFSKRGKYVKHFLMHRNDFYYMCNICDQGFNEYPPYEQHVNKHLNKTPYKCLKCDLAFTAKALLQCHKKRMHKRNAYSECTVCKKNINKFWLAGHMKRHEEKVVRKYLCEQCGKEVRSKLSLSRHILKHTGERPHMCKYCGATFKVPGALKQHERKHTGERPYKCEVCGKTFAFNTPYTYHLRTHTGERPYTCQYCGMTFAQPSPFAVHKRLHTGERPYKCKICDDAFPSHAAVRNHMQTHANSGNVQKRTRTTQGTASKPKKPRKGRSVSVVDSSSSSDSEKAPAEVDVVQPRRRSGRQTKCTKSLIEEPSDSEENQNNESCQEN